MDTYEQAHTLQCSGSGQGSVQLPVCENHHQNPSSPHAGQQCREGLADVQLRAHICVCESVCGCRKVFFSSLVFPEVKVPSCVTADAGPSFAGVCTYGVYVCVLI